MTLSCIRNQEGFFFPTPVRQASSGGHTDEKGLSLSTVNHDFQHTTQVIHDVPFPSRSCISRINVNDRSSLSATKEGGISRVSMYVFKSQSSCVAIAFAANCQDPSRVSTTSLRFATQKSRATLIVSKCVSVLFAVVLCRWASLAFEVVSETVFQFAANCATTERRHTTRMRSRVG